MMAMKFRPPCNEFAVERRRWCDEVRKAVVRGDLPLSAHSVAVVLAEFVNSKSRIAWPSERTIAAQLRLREGTVQKLISQLRRAGFLIIRRTNKKLTNRYSL